MGYWKSKVLPKIKKVFEKNNSAKKAAAAEATKSFDESKEEINKELEEKKAELHPKVVEIYEASSVEIKTLVKEPKEAGLKKHSAIVHKFLDELAKIEFPGSKPACQASSKFGPHMVPGPVIFVLEKVSTFVVVQEKEVEAPAQTEREIVVEEEVTVVADKAVEETAEPAKGEPEPEPTPAPAPAVEEPKAEAPKP